MPQGCWRGCMSCALEGFVPREGKGKYLLLLGTGFYPPIHLRILIRSQQSVALLPPCPFLVPGATWRLSLTHNLLAPTTRHDKTFMGSFFGSLSGQGMADRSAPSEYLFSASVVIRRPRTTDTMNKGTRSQTRLWLHEHGRSALISRAKRA